MKPSEFPTAVPFLPKRLTLPQLQKASKACQGCDLFESGVQTVFGEGPTPAAAMFVGEQPGHVEEQLGHPFVGPSGKLFDEALEEVGIERDEVYVTNAVKHFKFTPSGKRRIHAKPNSREISACRPWLEAEIQVVKPQLIVALGATAAQDLMGKDFRITRDRGVLFDDLPLGPRFIATIHPSALLRIPDSAERKRAYEEFVEDLAKVAKTIKQMH